MNKYVLVTIGVLVLAFAGYLGAIYGIAISFAFLSIIVATFFASRSLKFTTKSLESTRETLKLTTESLELTRNAIRPFVSSVGTIPVSYTADTITLTFQIINSGSIPASNVNTLIDFFDKDEEVKVDNLSNKYLPPNRQSGYSLMLPKNMHYEKFILDMKDKGDIQLWQNIQRGEVKLRLRTTYESLGRKHGTIQTNQIVKLKGQKDLQLIPVLPQEWY